MRLTDYVTTSEAAQQIGVTDRHVRALLTSDPRRLDGIQVGGVWLVSKKSLAKFSRHPTKGRPVKQSG